METRRFQTRRETMGRKRKPKSDAPKIGHNGGMVTDENRRKIASYVAEVERVEAQIVELRKEAGEIFKAADKANFDTKALRAIVRERKVDKAKRDAFDAVLDAYRHALGMLSDLPLGQAALARAAREGPTAELPHAAV